MSSSVPCAVAAALALLCASGPLRAQQAPDELGAPPPTETEDTQAEGVADDRASADADASADAGADATTEPAAPAPVDPSEAEPATPTPVDSPPGDAPTDAPGPDDLPTGSVPAEPSADSDATDDKPPGPDVPPITEAIGERDNPSLKSFARTTVVSQEVALSPTELGTVAGASAAACVGCTVAPVLGGLVGCGATVFLSSAASPCVGFGGGTAAALFGCGGLTLVSVPFLLGPANIAANLAATAAALFFGTDFDADLVLRVLAGAVPGGIMAVLSVAALVGGVTLLVLGLLAAPMLAGGSLVLALGPAAAVLAAAAFNGLLAGVMTFAGVTATSLTNTRWDDAGTLEAPAAAPQAAARRDAVAMAY
jgi:hypothetical protein